MNLLLDEDEQKENSKKHVNKKKKPKISISEKYMNKIKNKYGRQR